MIKKLSISGLLRVLSIVLGAILLYKVFPIYVCLILLVGLIYLGEYLIKEFYTHKINKHNIVYDIVGFIISFIWLSL